MHKIKLLTRKEDISFFLENIEKSKTIAIDIEFMRRNTFFPEPCIIQISDGNNHSCIDLTLNVNYKEIFDNILNQNKTIIIHSCRQDLEILYMTLGYTPLNIFDTQFAASFLGFKYQIGYAEIVKEILKININKNEKMTDWKKRPLTENQLTYAVNDVIYLNNLYEYLLKKLIETKKINFFEEEFNNFLNDIELQPNYKLAWKRIRTINSFSDKLKNIIKILAVWREKKAITLNLPRNWILTEKEIIDISKYFANNNKILLPKNKNILDLKQEALEIEDEINKFLFDKSYDDIKPKKTIHNYRHTLNELYEYYKIVSLKNHISHEIMSPKKLVLDFLKNNNRQSKLVNGWRKELIDIKKISSITEEFFNSYN